MGAAGSRAFPGAEVSPSVGGGSHGPIFGAVGWGARKGRTLRRVSCRGAVQPRGQTLVPAAVGAEIKSNDVGGLRYQPGQTPTTTQASESGPAKTPMAE